MKDTEKDEIKLIVLEVIKEYVIDLVDNLDGRTVYEAQMKTINELEYFYKNK